ncbi:MAG TPA: hypothetical protein VF420_13315 [Casimicrobiaceae bacterium]
MSSKARRIEKRLEQLGSRAVLFGGRTIEVRVYVNTDETVEQVVKRLRPAAAGPFKRMTLLAGGERDGDDPAVQELWKLTGKAVATQVAKDIDEEN